MRSLAESLRIGSRKVARWIREAGVQHLMSLDGFPSGNALTSIRSLPSPSTGVFGAFDDSRELSLVILENRSSEQACDSCISLMMSLRVLGSPNGRGVHHSGLWIAVSNGSQRCDGKST
jgi:hypothetical protein